MSDTPWTPGPWRVTEWECVRDKDNNELAHAVGDGNARLIAAAPELVDLLIAVSGDLGPILVEKTAGGAEVGSDVTDALDHLQDVRLLLIRIGRAKP